MNGSKQSIDEIIKFLNDGGDYSNTGNFHGSTCKIKGQITYLITTLYRV